MRAIYHFFSSLRLTVWLLALSMALVFFGTLDQVTLGLRGAQQAYFESILAIWKYPETWPGGSILGHLGLPIPGGYLLGPLLFLNLVAAHFRYFRWGWRVVGIGLIHGGILLFLVGQLVTNLTQQDYFVWMEEGGQTSYLQSFHEDELAVIDTTAPDKDRVTAIPAALLSQPGRVLALPGSPLKVTVRQFFHNARIGSHPPGSGSPLPASQGLGASLGLVASEMPPTTRPNERNATTAVVEVLTPTGSLGTWMVSSVFDDQLPAQGFQHEGRSYRLEMRPQRRYLPFSLALKDFTHDRWPGTQIPRNYASTVLLQDPRHGDPRQVVISMNQPLRHDGWTFYQASFARQDTASMLQVVRNPGVLLPYIACALVTLGLAWQFGSSLARFLRGRQPAASAPTR